MQSNQIIGGIILVIILGALTLGWLNVRRLKNQAYGDPVLPPWQTESDEEFIARINRHIDQHTNI